MGRELAKNWALAAEALGSVREEVLWAGAKRSDPSSRVEVHEVCSLASLTERGEVIGEHASLQRHTPLDSSLMWDF